MMPSGEQPKIRAAVDDFSQVAPVETVVSSRGRGWRGLEAMRFRHTTEEIDVPPFLGHVVIVHLGHPVDVEERIGGRFREGHVIKGDVAIIPAGMPSRWFWKGQEADRLHLYLDPAFVSGTAAEAKLSPDGIELVGELKARDPFVEQVGLSLLFELEAGGLAGPLYAEALANALSVHLLRRHSSLGRKAVRGISREGRVGGVPRPALRRVLERVEDDLAGDLTLADLAREANLSRYHFARLFKESTGLPPHRYVVGRRVERAAKLLAGTESPISEIAREVGFANQAQLNYHLKRLLGLTPAALRRQSLR